MMRAFVVALCLALAGGCGDESPDLPVRPGGGGGGNGGGGDTPDGSVGIDAGAAAITGLVCPIVDFRFPTSCDSLQTGAGVDLVELVTGSTASADDQGNFSIATAGGSNATLVVAAGDLTRRNSVLPTALVAGSASVIAPVMLAADYDQLQLVLGVIESDDSASVALYVRSGGLPASGVNVVAPAGSQDVYYDSNVASFDPVGPTQSFGTVLMFGVPVENGLVDFTVVRPDQTTIEVKDVPVQATATTFLRVDL